MEHLIIGVVTTVFLIFLGHAHLKAQRQKVIATRLNSYLMYWQGVIIDNDFFAIFHMGVEWNKEINEIISNGRGAEDLVELARSKKKKETEEIKKIIEEYGKTIEKADMDNLLRGLPNDTVDQILQSAKQTEQNLIDGKTFISDEDASYLGRYVAQTAIELKMELISMLNFGVWIIVVILSSPEDFDLKDHADTIVKIVWKGIVVSKHIDTLSKKMDYFSRLSTFQLTMKNLQDKL